MPTPERTKGGLAKGLRAMEPLMRLVNISMSRLVVHKNVYANEVYLPMEGGCQDPVYNTWHLLYMREQFMQLAGLDPTLQKREIDMRASTERMPRPVMMLIKRTHGSAHTRNRSLVVVNCSHSFFILGFLFAIDLFFCGDTVLVKIWFVSGVSVSLGKL